VSYALVSPESN